MRFGLSYRRNEDGAIAVEAALVLPFLIALGFGAVDLSLLMVENHKMEAGLTSAGNYLARTPAPQSYEVRAKRLAVTGQVETGGAPVISGWDAQDVSIQYRQIANGGNNGARDYRGGDIVQVIELSSEFDYQGIGLIRSMTGGRLVLKATHQERVIGGA